MKIKGEDLVAGLVDWVKSEIKEAPKQAYDLGKFFFTVSIGTVGTLAAIEKLNATSAMDAPMIISLVVLFASMLIALDLARPRIVKITGDSDLLTAYTTQVESAILRVKLWFIVWLVGVLFGGYAVHS
jgi:hypothetical protein